MSFSKRLSFIKPSETSVDFIQNVVEAVSRAIFEPILGDRVSEIHPIALALLTWSLPAAVAAITTACLVAFWRWWQVEHVKITVRRLREAGDPQTFIVLVGDFSGIGRLGDRAAARDTAKAALEVHLGEFAPPLARSLHVFAFPRQLSRKRPFGFLLSTTENSPRIAELNAKCKATLAEVNADLFVTGERGDGIVNLLIVPAGGPRTKGGLPEILSLADRPSLQKLLAEAIASGAAIASGLDPGSSRVLDFDNITADELDLLTRKIAGLVSVKEPVFSESLQARIEDSFIAAMRVSDQRLIVRPELQELWDAIELRRALTSGRITLQQEGKSLPNGMSSAVAEFARKLDRKEPELTLFDNANGERALGKVSRNADGDRRLRNAISLYETALSQIDLKKHPHEWALAHCHIVDLESELRRRDPDQTNESRRASLRASMAFLSTPLRLVNKVRAPEPAYWLNLCLAQCAMAAKDWNQALIAAIEAKSCAPEWAPALWAQAKHLQAKALLNSGAEDKNLPQVRAAIDALRQVNSVAADFESFDKVSYALELARSQFVLAVLEHQRNIPGDYVARLEEIISAVENLDPESFRPADTSFRSDPEMFSVIVADLIDSAGNIDAFLEAKTLMADSLISIAELAPDPSRRRSAAENAAFHLSEAAAVATAVRNTAYSKILHPRAEAAAALINAYERGS